VELTEPGRTRKCAGSSRTCADSNTLGAHDFGQDRRARALLVKAKKLFAARVTTDSAAGLEFVNSHDRWSMSSRARCQSDEAASSSAGSRFGPRRLGRKAGRNRGILRVIGASQRPHTVLAPPGRSSASKRARRQILRAASAATSRRCFSRRRLKSLSVMPRLLSPEEVRRNPQSRVATRTRFLVQIPWGKTFARRRRHRCAHHERPERAPATPIACAPKKSPWQLEDDEHQATSRRADTSDRPYKRAVPVEKALDILGFRKSKTDT